MKNTNRFKSLTDVKALPVKDFYRADVSDVCERIKKRIGNKETIYIRGDYDVDGCSAMAILITAIQSLGGQVNYRAPKRFSEGFGLSPSMIEEIPDKTLVITVDNGIVAFEAANKAVEKEIELVITDHHQPKTENGLPVLPTASAVINPHIQEITGENDWDFTEYCGAGIALKIAEALLGENHPDIGKLYAFAAIATVADVVPLIEDNRLIYIRGCEEMRKGNVTDGLYQLFMLNKIDVNNLPVNLPAHLVITAETIGFKIAPCMNAVSRLNDDGAELLMKCLLSDGDNAKARMDAQALYDANEERKNITTQEIALLDNLLVEEKREEDCPIVLHSPDLNPGIIGIDAGRFCEAYGVPAIIITGRGTACHASCRSPEGIDMMELLNYANKYLTKYGGHKGAAGLSIDEKDIDAFRNDLIGYTKSKGIHPIKPEKLFYDIEISAEQISEAFDAVAEMAPFGECNPTPVFLVKRCHPGDTRVLGQKHLKMFGDGVATIGFGMAKDGTPEIPAECDELVTLEYNVFRGTATPQLNARAISDTDGNVLYVSE